MSRHVALLLFCLGLLVRAQEFRSTITGQVLDSQSAAIPNAKVTATELDTGARYETVSGPTGEFSLPFLTPGAYRLVAEAQGFKRYVQERLQVGTNQRIGQNVVLEVGNMVESVTITADAPLLNTASASVGQVISSQQVESMPLNGRTPLVLAQLAFGVVPNADPRFTRPFDNAGPSGFSMGGGQGQSNELLLDGSPDMTRNRRVAYNPPVDAVNEIKVEVFQTDAAYGNTSGGTVNVVMKGGTNQFHGTLYEFNQVSRLKATPFFTNAASGVKPVTRFNQYGGTVGGPVWIPKLYDGHNRLFFFFAYEGIRQSEPEPTFATVPTEAQRRGDFSSLLALGPQFQIYDPATAVLEGGRIRREPFAGNLIPAGRLSPVGRNILNLIPLPNQAGAADGRNNYFNNAVRSDRFESYMGRLDVNVSDRHKLFGNFRFNDRLENRGNLFDNIATGNFLSRVNYGGTVDDIHTFTPTLLLNTRFNWTRFVEGSTRPSDGYDFTQLGFPASLAAASSRRVLPLIDFGTFNDIGNSGGDSTPFDSFQVFSALTKMAGAHTLKFGADLRLQRESSNSFGNSSGSYTFGTDYTRGPFNNSATAPIGQDLASLLLGLPTGGNFDVNATRTQHAYYLAFFANDDWRVRSNLTINAGLRYERETGTVERFDRTIATFDPAAQNRLTAAARAAYARSPIPLLPASQFNPTGGVVFAAPGNRSVYSTYPWAFSPRLGASWSPAALGQKTVVRGAVGLYYSTYGTFGIQQPGFSQRTALNASTNNFLTPNVTLSNPFPTGLLEPVGASLGVDTFLGQNVTFNNPNLAQPYNWRWGFNVQRELARNYVVEVGYIGSRATKLTESRDLNFIPLEYLSASPNRDQANIDRLTALVPNPFAGLLPGLGLNSATVSVETLLRPFPQFSGNGGVRVENQNNGRSLFHMLQARLEKRYANGLQFLTNFQYSKMIEATGRLNAADPFLERRIAGEDRPYRLVFSGGYELPFGRGKAIGSDANGLVDRLIGGWQVNAIYTLQAGPPVEWGNVIYFGGDLDWDARGVAPEFAFDVTRFNRNAAQQLDRNRRTFSSAFSTYRADRINNVDASVIKSIRLVEQVQLQFRAEAFNLLNRVSFNGPETNPTNGNFGRITSQANLPRALQLALRVRF